MRIVTLALLSTLAATTAFAKTPSPTWSTWPSAISLVGTSGGVADSLDGTFEVVVRDIANNPTGGVPVWIDLSSAPDLRFCADQGGNVSCSARYVSQLTDSRGIARFALTGGARAGVPPSGRGSVHLFADGLDLTVFGPPGGLVMSAYDLDGVGGVGGNDLSLWLGDFGSLVYGQRDDYDSDGVVGGNDLSLLLKVWGSGHSNQSCASYCP